MSQIKNPHGRAIKNVYAELEEHAKDYLEKLNILKNSIPSGGNGLVVSRYPGGIPTKLLVKVIEALEGKKSIASFNLHKIEVKNVCYHLVKNNSPMHDDYEKFHLKNGGIVSTEIADLGDFLICEIEDGLEMIGHDFSLYKTSEDFHI